jgi:hypothetical protein
LFFQAGTLALPLALAAAAEVAVWPKLPRPVWRAVEEVALLLPLPRAPVAAVDSVLRLATAVGWPQAA